jgi:hypothetical protein
MHFEIVFTPAEKRSYYDCIHIKTDDGLREYMLPVHAYPGQRMVLEHVPAPHRGVEQLLSGASPARAKGQASHAQRKVQDVWRLEQFALTCVDSLRSGLEKARVRIAEVADARTKRRVEVSTGGRVGRGSGGGEAADVEGYGDREQQEAEDGECARALEQMQMEIEELEKEIFLGPGVEMSRHPAAARRPSAESQTGFSRWARERGPRGIRNGGGAPFDTPFDYPIKPLNPHPRGTPTPVSMPWQYVRASEYVPYSSTRPHVHADDG